MPDFLTAEDRAAIAAYTGPIRIIPRGVSGLQDIGAAITMRSQVTAQCAQARNAKEREARKRAERHSRLPPLTVIPGEAVNDTIARLTGDGHSYADVGKLLGLSLNAVRNRLSRMRSALQEAA